MKEKRAAIWKRILAVVLTIAMLPVGNIQPVKAEEMVRIQVDIKQSDGPALAEQVNAYRRSAVVSGGAVTLGELEYNYNLENAAIHRALELALVYDKEKRPDGQPSMTIYGDVADADMVGTGSASAAVIFSQWQISDRAKIENADYKTMGVGHVVYNGGDYWAAAFSSQNINAPRSPLDGIQTMGVTCKTVTKTLVTDLTSTLNLNVGDTRSFAGAKPCVQVQTGGRDCPVVAEGTLGGTSDNTAVALVEGTTIKAVGPGRATIQISYGAYKAAAITVNVSKPTMTIDAIPDQNYTGYAIQPPLTVRVGNKVLAANTEYTVEYYNNIQKCVKTAYVKVTGKGAYSGYSAQANFSIVTPTIANATVYPIQDQTYTGSPIYPSFTVYMDNRVLQQGTDYNVTYQNNTNVGTASIVITGINSYSGTKTVTFRIIGPSLYAAVIDAIPDQLYTGSNIMPQPTVRLNNQILIQNLDYSVSYQNNRNIGTAVLTINGRGSYTGTKTATFRIIDRNLSYATVKSIPNQRYTGSEVRPQVQVTLGGTVLRENVDYTLSYQNNRQPGTATVVITGAGSYKGSTSVTFKITQASLSSATVKVSNVTYNGDEREPNVTVKLNGDELEEGEDFEVEYRNNTKPGKATVVVYGMGYYSGTKKATFVIKPKKQNLKSAKASGNSAALVWTKHGNVKGYEIYRSKKKSSGYSRIGTFTTNKTTACRNTNLKRGTYYYKIRSYIVVDGKKYYGAFSNIKKVTIR